MALPSQNRLSLREYRGRFFGQGYSYYSPVLQLIVLKETSTSPQFAVSISKKITKKAHQRNKLRRQILQLVQNKLLLFPSYKFLILPKKTAIFPTIVDLRSSIEYFVSKLK